MSGFSETHAHRIAVLLPDRAGAFDVWERWLERAVPFETSRPRRYARGLTMTGISWEAWGISHVDGVRGREFHEVVIAGGPGSVSMELIEATFLRVRG